MQMSDANSGLGGQSVSARLSGGNLNLADPAQVSGANAHPLWIEERARIAVNRNVRVAGRLVFQEPIRIDGHFRGEVSSSELVVISEDGSVGGRVRSPRLVVLGELEGDITASKTVVLGPRSRFKGKIEADNLTICEGAYLNADLRIGCRSDIRRSDAEPVSRSPERAEGKGVRDGRIAERKRSEEDVLRRKFQ
jgi:cytoskeletal protein CcmA (bactofilin family)